MRKILIVLIAIISTILVAFFGWYFFFRNPNIPAEVAIRDILPFGSAPTPSGVGVPTSDPTGASEEIEEISSRPATNLFRISNTPVAGAVIFTKNNQTIVRYVDRATGHIYDTDLATLAKTKVTNQTLPKIYEAYFRPDGNAVLLRSLNNDSDVVENLFLTLTPPKATSTLYAVSSVALRGNIGAVATADSGNTLFYALRDTSTIISSTFNGTGARTLLTSPFTDWRLAVAGNNLVVYTKASASAAGYAYTLNTTSRVFTKILGPLNGLVVVPNNLGNRVMYSYTENNVTRAFAKNLTNNALTEILPTTLAEKCVWSIRQTGILFCAAPIDEQVTGEPDNWYRGETHFSDRIWLFDTNIDIAQVLVEPKQSFNVDIDVIDPKLSPDENYLVFINKTDLSLWALKLEQF
ncbi:MAG: hypothetical protein Q8Q92_04690 [bacterium]|nr:hypothetical protein [bacterium]